MKNIGYVIIFCLALILLVSAEQFFYLNSTTEEEVIEASMPSGVEVKVIRETKPKVEEEYEYWINETYIEELSISSRLDFNRRATVLEISPMSKYLKIFDNRENIGLLLNQNKDSNNIFILQKEEPISNAGYIRIFEDSLYFEIFNFEYSIDSCKDHFSKLPDSLFHCDDHFYAGQFNALILRELLREKGFNLEANIGYSIQSSFFENRVLWVYLYIPKIKENDGIWIFERDRDSIYIYKFLNPPKTIDYNHLVKKKLMYSIPN